MAAPRRWRQEEQALSYMVNSRLAWATDNISKTVHTSRRAGRRRKGRGSRAEDAHVMLWGLEVMTQIRDKGQPCPETWASLETGMCHPHLVSASTRFLCHYTVLGTLLGHSAGRRETQPSTVRTAGVQGTHGEYGGRGSRSHPRKACWRRREAWMHMLRILCLAEGTGSPAAAANGGRETEGLRPRSFCQSRGQWRPPG